TAPPSGPPRPGRPPRARLRSWTEATWAAPPSPAPRQPPAPEPEQPATAVGPQTQQVSAHPEVLVELGGDQEAGGLHAHGGRPLEGEDLGHAQGCLDVDVVGVDHHALANVQNH